MGIIENMVGDVGKENMDGDDSFKVTNARERYLTGWKYWVGDGYTPSKEDIQPKQILELDMPNDVWEKVIRDIKQVYLPSHNEEISQEEIKQFIYNVLIRW